MDVKLPKLGEGAESGTVVNVLVKPGDAVIVGQALIELENEKAVAPIPSTHAGVVAQLRVSVGDTLSVGQPIVSLSPGATGAAATAPEPAPQTAPTPPQAMPMPPRERPAPLAQPAAAPPEVGEVVAPPSVRRLARQLAIDLARVRGTGSGGRILLEDLKAFIQSLQAGSGSSAATPAAKVAPAAIDFSQWGAIEEKKLPPIRRTISRRMAENWNTIPHVTQFDEIDITTINDLRKEFAAAYQARGARLTLTPFVLKALASLLRSHREFNASLGADGGTVIFKHYVHIGVAVDTDQGLMVPVIRDVDKKSMLELARELVLLAEKARKRSIQLEEMQGGTFTLSNQGAIGGSFFTPIINKPEVAILGVGRGQLKAVVQDGAVVPRLLMPVGLSYDHRLIDGGLAARFMVQFAEMLQHFKASDVALDS